MPDAGTRENNPVPSLIFCRVLTHQLVFSPETEYFSLVGLLCTVPEGKTRPSLGGIMEAKPVNDVQYNHMGKSLFWALGPDVESDKSVRYDKWGCTNKVLIYTVALLS